MEQPYRRGFLAQTAAGLAAPAILSRAAVNANDTVRVAALCDVDEGVLGARMKELEPRGSKPKTYTDVRTLLRREYRKPFVVPERA